MQPVLSREQIRAFDRQAIAAGVPGLVLMENAGRAAAEVALGMLQARGARPGRVLVVCGGGNNGGDGYVVARLLRTRGVTVEVLSAVPCDRLQGDALAQAKAWFAIAGEPLPEGDAWVALPGALGNCDLVVDALLGTGGNRPVEGPLLQWIQTIGDSKRTVLALDVPSGLDAETGSVLGAALRAEVTVTFAHWKQGLLTTAGHEYAGTIHVRDIGVPGDAFGWQFDDNPGPAAWLVETRDLVDVLRPRPPTGHKGSSGRVSVVAGSPGKVGAARLAARGALRAGAGLVTIVARAEAAEQLEMSAVEEMTARLDPERPEQTLARMQADAFVVGPGLGLDEAAARIVTAALERPEPVLLDADALHLLALDSASGGSVGGGSVSDLGEGARILTPHPGEAARLLGRSVAEVEENRFEAARALADRFRAVVVLKGSRTIVAAPGEVPRVSAWGAPLLATGGTGDVLSGLIGALLAHYPPFVAAWLGVSVHALAGEHLAIDHFAINRRARRDSADPAAVQQDRGVLAREVADAFPAVFAKLLR